MDIDYNDLKLKVTQDKFDDICRNIYQYMKNDCSKQNIDIFYYIEMMYKIKSDVLKDEPSSKIVDIRNFTLYLLVKYSNVSSEEIAKDFVNITIEDLKCIENDKILDIKYEVQVKIFLDNFKEDYLDFMYLYLKECEELKTSNFFNNLKKGQ
ncbi:MAG: hypothetical protein U9R37_03655 [Campylobacterota bacterium]|nr:hypothetical protein [Campylobacterota bacterium]